MVSVLLSVNWKCLKLLVIFNLLFISFYIKDLSHNLFSGSIPKEIGSLQNLKNLYLQDNKLSGEIPQEVVSNPSLVVLGLSNNYFEGAIPNIVSKFMDCPGGAKVDFSCCSMFNLGAQVCLPVNREIPSNCITGNVLGIY